MGMNSLTAFIIYLMCLIFVFNPVDMLVFVSSWARDTYPAQAGQHNYSNQT